MAVMPGWYPDPVGDFRERWWAGTGWTEHVRTGRFTTTAPLGPTAIPEEEILVWSDGRHRLTTHAAYVDEGRGQVQIPWWMVADVDTRVSAAQSLGGLGSVVLIVNYPGYTDRREWRMTGLAEMDRVAAACFTWSRRHRRRVGLP